MLNTTSDNPAHLAQLTLRPDSPLPHARTEARTELFPQNQNRIWKITLKDPFVLKFDLSLQVRLFLIPSFYF
jgi:hypothetical protein